MPERSPLRRPWGICLRDLPTDRTPGSSESVIGAIDEARSAGLSVLHLPSPSVVSAGDDLSPFREVGDYARERGVALHMSLPPAHPDRASTDGGDAAGASRPFGVFAAGELLGVALYQVTVGREEDRFTGSPSWADQCERAVPLLSSLVSRAPAPVALKTHEEMTTFEAAALCRAVPGLGIGFSPVNVVVRMEDPRSAFERIEEFVTVVYVDDCDIVRRADGLARAQRVVGTGSIDWTELSHEVKVDVPFVVDLHRAELAMPIYRDGWVDIHPDLSVSEMTRVFALAGPGRESDSIAIRRDAAWRGLAR